jgi:hypothetical protein
LYCLGRMSTSMFEEPSACRISDATAVALY